MTFGDWTGQILRNKDPGGGGCTAELEHCHERRWLVMLAPPEAEWAAEQAVRLCSVEIKKKIKN